MNKLFKKEFLYLSNKNRSCLGLGRLLVRGSLKASKENTKGIQRMGFENHLKFTLKIPSVELFFLIANTVFPSWIN